MKARIRGTSTRHDIMDRGKQDKRRLKSSTWFLTINTNISTKSSECLKVKMILENSINNLEDIFVNYLFVPDNAPIAFQNDNLNLYDSVDYLNTLGIKEKKKLIESIGITYVIEEGKRENGSKLHAHIIIRVQHRTHVHLKYDEMRYYFRTFFASEGHTKNFYMHFKVKTGELDSLIGYVRKDLDDDEDLVQLFENLTLDTDSWNEKIIEDKEYDKGKTIKSERDKGKGKSIKEYDKSKTIKSEKGKGKGKGKGKL